MTKEQFETITKWQRETFVNASANSKVAHLMQEVKELDEELNSRVSQKNIEMEFADCFLLLFGAASSYGMDYTDICNAIDEKMEINYKRKWGKPDVNGVVNHIKQTP